MWLQLRLFVVLVALVCLQAMDFEIVGDNTRFFGPCEQADNRGTINLTDLIDISQLRFTEGEDGETVYTNGAITVKSGVPENVPIRLEIIVHYWLRGMWTPTIYTMRRADMCKAAFDESELWHDFIFSIPEEQRHCPPKAGELYTFRNSSNRVIMRNMSPSMLPGKYKAVFHLSTDRVATCLSARFNIYQV